MLRTEGLTKNYGKQPALSELTLNIPKGSIYGFVGPNGAGKTTTMRIVSALIKPTKGTAWVEDINVQKNPGKVRRKIGYMPDFFGVYDNLKVTEYLDFYGSCYGINKTDRQKTAIELLELVDLADKQDAYVDTLSRGMKQRLCLARCLIHDPVFVILDEPASGMDPRARAEMKVILKTLKDMGKTILISSHILPELSEMCDSIAILTHGKLTFSGSVEEIMAQVSGNQPVRIRVLDGMENAIQILREHTAIGSIEREDNVLDISFDADDTALAALLGKLVSGGIQITSFGRVPSNLERVFMTLTDENVTLTDENMTLTGDNAVSVAESAKEGEAV